MDHEKGNTLKVYIKQYLNRYKGCFALVAGIMIFYIFTLYLCGVSAADIRYFAGLEKSVLYDMQQELFWINQYINMALQYQRMNSGMNDLVLEMVSADQVVRTAIRRFAPIMIRKKIAIHYEECREMVLSDEKWLEFVVEQILSNAIKYSGENRAVTIQINRNEADNTCELVISDQGIGIRKEDLPRIFEKGYTGYNGRADKTSTGIGLYLCREITKKLGHGIMITSEIGKGTDVTIVFERNNLDVRD